MEIKVLGPGCAKCKSTYNVIEKVLKENDIDAKLTKVDDIMEMMNYNIMTSPAVVIDEVVKLKGKVPTESEVKELLGRICLTTSGRNNHYGICRFFSRTLFVFKRTKKDFYDTRICRQACLRTARTKCRHTDRNCRKLFLL